MNGSMITKMSITELATTLVFIITRLDELAIDEADNIIDWQHIDNARGQIERGLDDLKRTSEMLRQSKVYKENYDTKR